ncbi:glycosyltransferase [Janibacter sp. GS2]|uniref:glycosyltransferase n=1 Tax=Janibacter sp. GS2 TaxID=3442646 RepID=UPI003EB8A002
MGVEEHVVVVLNFHGRDDTERCVASLVEGSPEAAVLVVDNGSHDGIVASVERRWPGVRTIQNQDNLGFAGGMNTGLRWAIGNGAKTVTVLNNDTIIPRGAIAALAAAASGGRAVSPEVHYADGSDEVWFGGGAIDDRTGLARHLSNAELVHAPRDASGRRPTDVLAGCCVTAEADTWLRVGLFDERYFLNFEDSDWSLRARAAGVDLFVDQGIVIHHEVSASFTGAYSYLGLFYYSRNGLLFIRDRINGSLLQRCRFLRHHVAPDPVGRWRRGQRRDAARRAAVVAVAVCCQLRHRYGRAPRWLEQQAGRWSSGRR